MWLSAYTANFVSSFIIWIHYMDLIEALSILSKSSPYAVSTERQQNQNFADLKDYLYIKTDIEKDFEEKINNLQLGDIIFLCGSSGDGKSEILTHYLI